MSGDRHIKSVLDFDIKFFDHYMLPLEYKKLL